LKTKKTVGPRSRSVRPRSELIAIGLPLLLQIVVVEAESAPPLPRPACRASLRTASVPFDRLKLGIVDPHLCAEVYGVRVHEQHGARHLRCVSSRPSTASVALGHSTASITSGHAPRVMLPPSPRFAPSCCLCRLASRRSGEREREKLDRSLAARCDGGLQLDCPARRWSPARWPPGQERTAASRSGENGGLQVGREHEKRENGRERDGE
jgi:hypothetical protein